MFERYDKSGSGHRGKGTESAGVKVRTGASPGYQQVGSSRSYPGKTATGVSTYKNKVAPLEPHKGGGNKLVSVSYPDAAPEPWPSTKAPFSLPAARSSRPKAL